ncbi:MAG: type I phosphomannose isomerase catalytic subunit [Candidatus Cryptobacteroides sp.]
MENKTLYPLKFIPTAEKKVWGGSSLVSKMGKAFVETDGEGNERSLTAQDKVGESWELADMGFIDSVVAEGWLAGNTIGELMDTYIERVSGEEIYGWFGRQFPLLVKFLDIDGRMSVHVHPDDDTAEQRYDSLGKDELWYILDARKDAKVYVGFEKDVEAASFYQGCQDGSVVDMLHCIRPEKGDVFHFAPGTVQAAEGGILAVEISESSDLTFRLFDWGRENNPQTARPMHVEEAFDFIDYSEWKEESYIPSTCKGRSAQADSAEVSPAERLFSNGTFTLNRMAVRDTLKISTEKFGRFIIYVCISGEASFQMLQPKGNEAKGTEEYILHKGETMLVPADVPDFFIVPRDRDTELLEVMTERPEEKDGYINPDTVPYLEGEDYEGLDVDDAKEDEDVND